MDSHIDSDIGRTSSNQNNIDPVKKVSMKEITAEVMVNLERLAKAEIEFEEEIEAHRKMVGVRIMKILCPDIESARPTYEKVHQKTLDLHLEGKTEIKIEDDDEAFKTLMTYVEKRLKEIDNEK